MKIKQEQELSGFNMTIAQDQFNWVRCVLMAKYVKTVKEGVINN